MLKRVLSFTKKDQNKDKPGSILNNISDKLVAMQTSHEQTLRSIDEARAKMKAERDQVVECIHKVRGMFQLMHKDLEGKRDILDANIAEVVAKEQQMTALFESFLAKDACAPVGASTPSGRPPSSSGSSSGRESGSSSSSRDTCSILSGLSSPMSVGTPSNTGSLGCVSSRGIGRRRLPPLRVSQSKPIAAIGDSDEF